MPDVEFLAKLEADIQKRVARSPGLAGVWVIDLATGRGLGANQDIEFSTASAIKVAVLAALHVRAGKGEIDLASTCTVESREVVGGTGVLQYLHTPISLRLDDIAALMVAVSDNTATNVLIDVVGMDSINGLIESVGLKHMRLGRKMGDHASVGRGTDNYSTPRDAAELMRAIWAGEILDRKTSDQVLSVLKTPKHSAIAHSIPRDVGLADKPGRSDQVSTEWALVLLKRRPYAFAGMVGYAPGHAPEVFLGEVAAAVHRCFSVLDRSNQFGRGVPGQFLP